MKKSVQTTPELIRAEIERLHKRGSSDWQTLLRQVNDEYRPLIYNLAQVFAVCIPPTCKELDLEWGRGTGKTTVAAHFAREVAQDLPRGVFQWIVPTYRKFLTEIIPAFIHGMEMQGMYQDLHYVVGKKPPASWGWPLPYKPPLRFENFIWFYNGFGINLLSQDIPGSGRGLSTDGEFADEAAMLNAAKMEENSTPSIRGSNLREFHNRRYFDFRLKLSSTPISDMGKWLIERERMADRQRHFYIRANCMVNQANLKPDYLKEARRTAVADWVFKAEYLNIRPKFTGDGFYYLLDEATHGYTSTNYGHLHTVGQSVDCRADADLVPTAPLILGVDWGAAINSLVVSQLLPGEFRVLKNFFVLGRNSETQDDMVDNFAEYYRHHPVREVTMWYDATGNFATGTSKETRSQQAIRRLISKGWKVRPMTTGGTNPLHYHKFLLWESLLGGKKPTMPQFRINRENARETWLSMSGARAIKDSKGEVKKDKRKERVDNPARQYATDLSDALDQPVFGLLWNLYKSGGRALSH